jgi:hypothetical protein
MSALPARLAMPPLIPYLSASTIIFSVYMSGDWDYEKEFFGPVIFTYVDA